MWCVWRWRESGRGHIHGRRGMPGPGRQSSPGPQPSLSLFPQDRGWLRSPVWCVTLSGFLNFVTEQRYSASRDRGDGQSVRMWTKELGKRPRLSGSDSRSPSIQFSSSVSSARITITSPSSNESSSSLSASQSYRARHFLNRWNSFLCKKNTSSEPE